MRLYKKYKQFYYIYEIENIVWDFKKHDENVDEINNKKTQINVYRTRIKLIYKI